MPHDQSTPSEALPTSIEQTDAVLWEAARSGARRTLQAALEAEIEAHVAQHQDIRDDDGRRMVVRNGHAPSRTILTGVGAVEVSRPRLDERAAVERNPDHRRFASGVLPRFLRRTPTVEGVIAVLYLKGVSTNEFDTVLQAIYGEQAGSLSAATVSRLKEVWYQEYEQWRTAPLEASAYAYIWADGVYFNARVEGERSLSAGHHRCQVHW